MDIVYFWGGLGNQMFQYALIEELRHRGRCARGSACFFRMNKDYHRKFEIGEVFNDIKIDEVDDSLVDELEKKWNEISQDSSQLNKIIADPYNRFFWIEEEDGRYNGDIFMTKECLFKGYWQSEKYFYHAKDEIRKQFTFRNGEKKLERIVSNLKENGNYVSVHIRRGDYLRHPEVFGGICTMEYYKKAFEYIYNNRENTNFIYFSDDIRWVMENDFPKGIYVLKEDFDEYHDWYDMKLMASCRDNIIANSSFSWWGAWLNNNFEKMVIAPKKWLANCSTPDICPVEWIRL